MYNIRSNIMADLNSTIVRGNLRVTDEIISSSLELSDGGIVNGHFIIKDGSLDLGSAPAGIKFNTKAAYITNIEVGRYLQMKIQKMKDIWLSTKMDMKHGHQRKRLRKHIENLMDLHLV